MKITLKNKETGVNQPEESEGTKQARGNEPGVEKIGEKIVQNSRGKDSNLPPAPQDKHLLPPDHAQFCVLTGNY